MSESSQNQKINNSDIQNKFNFDPDLAKKIMEVQSLPEEVVVEFLRIQGTFNSNNDAKEQ